MKNQIILILGPKHSGKSQCAFALEKITGAEAADLDTIIEKQTGKTPRILYKEGPEIFRKTEVQALKFLIENNPQTTDTPQNQKLLIIAAGGGLVDNTEALKLLSGRKDIITVYLDVSPETAWQRILNTAAGGELPPFLNTENPRETHFALHKRRAEAYKNIASLTISAENKSPEEIAAEIWDITRQKFMTSIHPK